MEKSFFEHMSGNYTQVGDYLIPNLRLPEQQSAGQSMGTATRKIFKTAP